MEPTRSASPVALALAFCLIGCGAGRQQVATVGDPANPGDSLSSAISSPVCPGFFQVASTASVGGWDPRWRDLAIDVDGDGRADLVRVWHDPSKPAGQEAYAQVSLSNRRGFVEVSNRSVGGWSDAYVDLAMDVNGDGRGDLVRLWQSGAVMWAQVTLSDGAGFQRASNVPVGSADPAVKNLVMDVNGDGKADLVRIARQGTGAWATVYLSTGNSFAQGWSGSVGGWSDAYVDLAMDVNGDGKTDLVRIWQHGVEAWAQVTLSDGAGLTRWVSNAAIGGYNAANTYLVMDVNGDHQADVVVLWQNAQGGASASVNLSTGAGFTQVSNRPVGGWSPTGIRDLAMDVNGDGKVDLVRVWHNGAGGPGQDAWAQVSISDGATFADLSNASVGAWDDATEHRPMKVTSSARTDLVRISRDSVSGQASATVLLSGSCTGTPPPPVDAGAVDAGGPPPPPSDAGAVDAGGPPPPPPGVGPHGGSVGLLHFGATGDTRPGTSEAQGVIDYPSAVIDQIASQLEARQAQFVLDMGDHMNNWHNLTTAQQQMAKYQGAMARYAGTWFMTMGNHECDMPYPINCIPFAGQSGSTAVNFTTFLAALQATGVSQLPWYAFDVKTSLGLAKFVVIADNAWCPEQQAWLEATLADADAHARYTLVMRHHPPDDGGAPAVISQLVRQHKFALYLTGHAHFYQHLTGRDADRGLIVGTGGAPLNSGSGALSVNGYLMVDQQPDASLKVSFYDSSSNAMLDQWAVGPNP